MRRLWAATSGAGSDLYPIDVIAALLARRVRRPVKVEFERTRGVSPAPRASRARSGLRTAADVSGRLLARGRNRETSTRRDVSWGSTTPYVMLATVAPGSPGPNGPLRHDDRLHEQSYSGSMRGYGNLESTFAVESQMDELADASGLDRLEIRRRNADEVRRRQSAGFVVTSCARAIGLEAVADAIRRAGAAGGGLAPWRRLRRACSTWPRPRESIARTAAAPS